MTSLLTGLRDYIQERSTEFGLIEPERVEQLNQLAGAVAGQLAQQSTVRITFICTHNSRRSHLAQLWAAAAAAHYGIDGIETYSGGTEATAFYQAAIDSLRHAGFKIELTHANRNAENPVLRVQLSPKANPIECFSKVYDQPPNPTSDYIAVLVCDHADQACPVVHGADQRFVVRYLDPKVSDGTLQQTSTYRSRCGQIAREMIYASTLIRDTMLKS